MRDVFDLTAIGIAFSIGLLLLSGCSSSDVSSDTTSITDEELKILLGSIYAPEPSDEQYELRRELETELEDKISSCMQAQGFEYPWGMVTEDISSDSPFFVDLEGRLVPDPEFVAQFGYGITAGQIYLHGWPIEGEIPEPSPDSILSDYQSTLPEEESRAFWLALDGSDDSDDSDPSTTGCLGEARESTRYGQIRAAVQDLRVESNEDITQRVMADPRMASAQDDWQECITGFGYEGRWSPELFEPFFSRLRELDESGAAEQRYWELLEEERLVATADLVDCGGGPKLDQLFDEIRIEVEAELLTES